MSVHTYPRLDRFPELIGLLPVHLVAPSAVASTDTTLTLTFTPDLTAPQILTLGRLVSYCRSALNLTAAEWIALEPFLTTGRAFQQLSQADFIALTQNARDRMLFDNVTAQWRVIRALLRD